MKTTAIVVFLLVLTGFAAWGFGVWQRTPSHDLPHESPALRDTSPRLENSADIGPGERASVLVIPHGDIKDFDVRCVVYTNTELRTSTMACPERMMLQPAISR